MQERGKADILQVKANPPIDPLYRSSLTSPSPARPSHHIPPHPSRNNTRARPCPSRTAIMVRAILPLLRLLPGVMVWVDRIQRGLRRCQWIPKRLKGIMILVGSRSYCISCNVEREDGREGIEEAVMRSVGVEDWMDRQHRCYIIDSIALWLV